MAVRTIDRRPVAGVNGRCPLVMSNFSFSHSVFYWSEDFLPFSPNLKLLSANSFNLEESKILCLGKGYYGILKIMYPILCKTKEIDPIKLISLGQINVLIALNYLSKNSV